MAAPESLCVLENIGLDRERASYLNSINHTLSIGEPLVSVGIHPEYPLHGKV